MVRILIFKAFLFCSSMLCLGQLSVSFNTVPSNNGSLSICEGSVIEFVDNSTNVPQGAVYNWSFPGGQPSSAVGQGPHLIEYNFDGDFAATLEIDGVLYSVSLTVLDGDFIEPDLEIDLNNGFGWGLSNFNNQQYFTLCSPSGFGELLDFSTTTSNTNANTQHIINWGDNSPLTEFVGENILGDQHIYSESGAYTISYTVVLESGCTYTQEYNLFIGASPNATVSTQGTPILCNPGSAVFNVLGGAQNVNGTIYTFQVNDASPPQIFTHEELISQGGVFNAQINSWVFSFTHVFNSVSCGVNSIINNTLYSNALQASITVSNPCGQSSNANGPYIIQSGPEASFISSPDDNIICLNSTVSFTDESIAGTNITGLSPNFLCNSNYKKYWTIQGPGGFIPITTSPSVSAGNVQANPFVSVLGNFGFNNNQPNNSLVWSNNSSNSIDVTFITPGTYTITLYTGSNNCGITSFTQTLCVIPSVEANFSLSENIGCTDLPVLINNNSSVVTCGLNNIYNWTVTRTNPENCPNGGDPGYAFANGTSANDFEPEIIFNSPGIYEVQLIVSISESLLGTLCDPDTAVQFITIKDIPFGTLQPIQV
ncbi:MAG: hypothetical protein NWR53_01340, partial [Crocinitomicaceae bacterium]|nr:hypothetical protein [Crocinitomicaceae bacterium]